MSTDPRRTLGLVADPKTGEFIGQHPDDISEEDLRALGHRPGPPMSAVRAFCRDCSSGSVAEIRKCTRTTCPLWLYRMGKRPARCSASTCSFEAMTSMRAARASS